MGIHERLGCFEIRVRRQVVYYHIMLSISTLLITTLRTREGLTRLEGALLLTMGFRIARGVVFVDVDAISILHESMRAMCLVLAMDVERGRACVFVCLDRCDQTCRVITE